MLRISVGDSRFQKTWATQETSWEALLKRLSETTRTPETVEEYAALPKSKQAAVKDVGGFVGGTLVDGRRGRGKVETRSLLTLDLDHGEMGAETMLDLTCPWKACVYSTHKHTPTAPRLRLIIPLSREVTEEEYEPLARRVAHHMGIDQFDDTTYEAHRLMYWPSTPRDGEYHFNQWDGTPLDPDKLLSEYEDWRDVTKWPTSLRQQTLHATPTKHQEDPTTKPGLVGAFCRAYNIHDAIETFLEGVYEPTASGDRYDYTPGESSNGVVTNNDSFAYSHHATDPAGGQLVNSFDLIRLHKFGGLDGDVKEGTPINRWPSYTAMQDLARKDTRVVDLLADERLAAAETEFGIPEEDTQWQRQLTYDRKGKVESTLPNVALILQHDPNLRGIAYDELWQAIAVREMLPWARPPVPWRDTDDAHLALYVEEKYGRFTARDLDAALAATADDRRFHPVRDYLQALPEWDQTPRVDTLLVDYLGADDSEYTRAVTRKLLCAAVRRVKQPGCKFDTMLILAGPQGVGKSTLAARLGGKWFNDSLSLSDTRDKTAAEKLQGFWIQEFGELAGMRKAEVETLRSFISRQDDIYRGSYERRVSRHPRQSVFIGTTNAEAGFLTDPAGNRRMWPVDTPGGAPRKPWHLTEADVQQIWAEVLTLEPDEKLYLEGRVAEDAVDRQRQAIETDERSGIVEDYLARLLPENWEDMSTFDRRNYLDGSEFGEGPSDGTRARQQVSVIEVWVEAFGKQRADLRRSDSYQITNILRRLGWESDRRTARVEPYGVQRIFTRPIVEAPF